jgi:hypothetical protein
MGAFVSREYPCAYCGHRLSSHWNDGKRIRSLLAAIAPGVTYVRHGPTLWRFRLLGILLLIT